MLLSQNFRVSAKLHILNEGGLKGGEEIFKKL